ncbi:MAG: recombinase A [Deltaproteobacteria bacterium]|nr:recombinase A [Deltaproteobacteria bacterium]
MASSASASVLSLLPPATRRLVDAPPTPRDTASSGDDELAFPTLAGRVVELSGQGASAVLTGALGLVRDAQLRGENAAWVQIRPDGFFPPDVADGGVDLEALPVVLAGDVGRGGRAATHLLRSGAFGLVVLDLGADAELPLPLQSRLAGLAQHHGAALLCLTEKPAEAPSLGSLVSLRAEARREERADGGYACLLAVQKDKRRGPGSVFSEPCHGPAGL